MSVISACVTYPCQTSYRGDLLHKAQKYSKLVHWEIRIVERDASRGSLNLAAELSGAAWPAWNITSANHQTRPCRSLRSYSFHFHT